MFLLNYVVNRNLCVEQFIVGFFFFNKLLKLFRDIKGIRTEEEATWSRSEVDFEEVQNTKYKILRVKMFPHHRNIHSDANLSISSDKKIDSVFNVWLQQVSF